jgi:hypothetical protein
MKVSADAAAAVAMRRDQLTVAVMRATASTGHR